MHVVQKFSTHEFWRPGVYSGFGPASSGVCSSTVNNDAISRLQICSPRCWIYCAEPDIITAHWNWGGSWSAIRTHSKLEIQRHLCFSRGHSWTESCKHWLRYVPASQLSSLLLFLMLAVGRQRKQDPNWKCPQRSFPYWQGVMSWTQWPGRLLGMLACRPTRHTSRDWSKCYSCGRTGHALIHLSKGNIKSFLGVIPHVNMSWIYLYMIKSFRVSLYKLSWAACDIFLGLQLLIILVWFAHIYHHFDRHYPRM